MGFGPLHKLEIVDSTQKFKNKSVDLIFVFECFISELQDASVFCYIV